MGSPVLRRIRIVFSVLVFFWFVIVFLDYRQVLPVRYHDYLLISQFIPSAVAFYDLRSLAGAGFIAVLVITLLTGRTYCSFLCPLGIGMDFNSRIGGKIRKKFRRYGFKKPFTFIRYLILAATVAVTAIYGIYALSLLDPYSIFGRFMTFFAKPVVLYVNNFAANNLERFDNYMFDHITVKFFDPVTYAIPAFFLLLVGGMSLAKGRLYCNMICPVGTLLGLLSKVSFLRIKINHEACTRCGRCAIRCKSSCIDFLHSKVDVTRCVDCFDCIYTCQDKAISYGIVLPGKKEHVTDESRRRNIIGALLLFMGAGEIARAQNHGAPKPKKDSTVKENRTSYVAPPGAGSIKRFNDLCTACSVCIAACPTGVLHPSVKQYGLTGLLQPVMDYHKSFCQYECTACTDICPTNALLPLVADAKKLTQTGRAVFIEENCIVKTEKTACGACSESCPTKAVFMVPYERNLLIPKVNAEICIGCGHCEYSCPTTPYKAIFVDGNLVHEVAKKPEVKASDRKPLSDFPF